MAKWIKAAEGIRYQEHPKRKNGINLDRYYSIYFRQAGKQVEQALGWGSKGVTLDFAKKTLARTQKQLSDSKRASYTKGKTADQSGCRD